MFCPSRFGFMHQNFTNYLVFLCLPRKKDPCTWSIKNIDMTNWSLWVKGWFANSGVAVSCSRLPVKMWLMHQNFTNYPLFLHCLMKKTPCTWWIKNIDMANWCLCAKIWFSYSGVLISHVWPVNIWLHLWIFHKSPFFVFSEEKVPCTW
jgi:hypothetical protein